MIFTKLRILFLLTTWYRQIWHKNICLYFQEYELFCLQLVTAANAGHQMSPCFLMWVQRVTNSCAQHTCFIVIWKVCQKKHIKCSNSPMCVKYLCILSRLACKAKNCAEIWLMCFWGEIMAYRLLLSLIQCCFDRLDSPCVVIATGRILTTLIKIPWHSS